MRERAHESENKTVHSLLLFLFLVNEKEKERASESVLMREREREGTHGRANESEIVLAWEKRQGGCMRAMATKKYGSEV